MRIHAQRLRGAVAVLCTLAMAGAGAQDTPDAPSLGAGARDAGAAPALPIPYVPDRPLDASAWPDGVGLRVAALADPGRDPAHPPAVAAGFRAGWNEQGIRLLVEVRDDTPDEAVPTWQGDSVEIFVAQDAEKGRHRLQFILAPGRADPEAGPRLEFLDARPREFRDRPPDPPFAARATDYGYAVEIAVPWADLDVAPEAGRTLGLQVEINDHVDGQRTKLRLHPRPAGGGDGELPMRAVRLAPAGPVDPVRWAENRTQNRTEGLVLHIVADAAWAGRAADVRLDGRAAGRMTFGPARGAWTDGVFQYLPEDRRPRPRRYEIALPDGTTHAFPYAVVIPCPVTIAEGMRGENYPLNGAMRYLMECLGEDRDFYSYRFFAGLTGDTFTQVHCRADGRYAYSLSDLMDTAGEFRPIFEAVGYDFTFAAREELAADPEAWRRAIVEWIDQGVPVIYKRDDEAPAVVNGYEGDGETLLGLAWNQRAPSPVEAPIERWRYAILAGQKEEPMERADMFRYAIGRVPTLLTLPERDGIVFGKAAYQRWADDLADPERQKDLVDGKWETHGSYVCLTLTNGFHRMGFLDMALWHGPDLAPQINALRLAHERMDPLHRRMMEMGAGFDLHDRALKDPETMEEVVRVIRRMGDVCDLALAWLRDPAQARAAEAEAEAEAEADEATPPPPGTADVF